MIIPFINFAGQANSAISFYETIFDVKDKQIAFYKDMSPEMLAHFPPETHDYVMHAEMTINGTQVWIGDSSHGVTWGDMVSIAVPLSSIEGAKITFDKLKEGGEIFMEPAATFYSPTFGVVKDKFGVVWHLICQSA